MPDYIDFISVFGSQSEPRDLRFSGFRGRTLLPNRPHDLAIPSLGRSGRQLQLCYNLKSVACLSTTKTDTRDREWSIRQAAFHHQFDIIEGTTLWIVAKGDLEIKTRVQEVTGNDGRPEATDFGTPERSFKASLAIHLLYCHWSTEGWRWYVKWLEEIIDQEVSNT